MMSYLDSVGCFQAWLEVTKRCGRRRSCPIEQASDMFRGQQASDMWGLGPTPEPLSASSTVSERLCATFSWCLVVAVQVR